MRHHKFAADNVFEFCPHFPKTNETRYVCESSVHEKPINIVIDFITQLMHSFEVNIRICQPQNSDVYNGEVGET